MCADSQQRRTTAPSTTQRTRLRHGATKPAFFYNSSSSSRSGICFTIRARLGRKCFAIPRLRHFLSHPFPGIARREYSQGSCTGSCNIYSLFLSDKRVLARVSHQRIDDELPRVSSIDHTSCTTVAHHRHPFHHPSFIAAVAAAPTPFLIQSQYCN